jgi:hypothetical protein
MRILRIKALENLVIKDKDKKTIYLAPKGKVFNLPVIGRVYVKGKYKRLPSKIITNVKLKYYKPEKSTDFKGIQRIVFSKNPNKCSIDVGSGTLVFDSDFFKKLNIAQLYFILSHELGHYFYFTEYKCDAFARAIMLMLGFNPSQIIASANSTLIDEFRKNENLAQLLKSK